MKTRPLLHIQNIFDAVNPNGMGVKGNLKLRCLHLQKRAVAVAKPGDILAISSDCSPAFVEYLIRTVGLSDVITLRHRVSADPNISINSQTLFSSLRTDFNWEAARGRKPVLSPYIISNEIYRVCQDTGISVSNSAIEPAKEVELSERMNDKAAFYKECDEIDVPVPRYWVFDGAELAHQIRQLLRTEPGPLSIRQTRSGGTVGNITATRIASKYHVPELRGWGLSEREFVTVLEKFSQSCFSNQFLVAELLDLYASPGTLFHSDEEGLTIICHSHQILDKNRVFLGFSFPIEDEKISRHFPSLEEWVPRIMEPWWREGFRGYGNIDWMVRKDGQVFLAERNARQTGVIPPLAIANACMGHERKSPFELAPKCSVVTRDALSLEKGMSFEQAHRELEKRKLLWGQSGQGEGAIISIPPSPEFGINSIGIVVLGPSVSKADEIYTRTLHALGVAGSELLLGIKG